MPIALSLEPKSYKTFITALRTQDRTSAAGTELEVTLTDVSGVNRSYYFRTPNFALYAFKIGTGAVSTLQSYNHVLPTHPVSKPTVEHAFREPHGTRMDADLSTIVTFTSEAARSNLVFNACMKVLSDPNNGKAMDLQELELLFTNYKKTAQMAGYVGAGDGFTYNTSWKPLVEDNYRHYFSAREYTGDRGSALKKLAELAAFYG